MKQGIYWFVTALACVSIPVIAPHIKELSLKSPFGEAILTVEQLKEFKQIKDSLALLKTFDYLEEDIELTKTQAEELKKTIENASPIVRDAIYAVAAASRELIAFNIIKGGPKQKIREYRMKFEKFIPVFTGMIDSKYPSPSLHMYYAQLAYVYKDHFNPNGKDDDWDNAYYYIDQAIKERDQRDDNKIPYTIYEFNRLICGVNKESLCSTEQMEADFDKVWNDTSTRFMLFDTNIEIKGTHFDQWVMDHKPDQKSEWEKSKVI